MNRNGFRFDKRYGQNFISDGNLLSSIVSLADIDGENVVEIGVGAATLTLAAAARARRVVGFEIDGRLRPVIEEMLSSTDNTEIIYADFMSVPAAELDRKLGEYVVLANLPYYITTPVIMKLVEESAGVKRIVVTVQQEVAERLAARAGTPEYGAITASIAITGDAAIVKRIPRTMFYPQPNVDSAVVRIDMCKPKYGVENVEFYRRTVRAGFANRRKTLENNIMSAFGLGREQAGAIISRAGIDPRVRGETLSAKEFAALSVALLENIG